MLFNAVKEKYNKKITKGLLDVIIDMNDENNFKMIKLKENWNCLNLSGVLLHKYLVEILKCLTFYYVRK